MTPLCEMPVEQRRAVQLVLADIDDTLTTEGRLGREAYDAMWALHEAGLALVPVSGRPAGWCECFARIWPIRGIVGENGGVAYTYDRRGRRMNIFHAQDPKTRAYHGAQLDLLRRRILDEVPGSGVASDQPFRLYDLAIDFCEDVPALDNAAVERIVELFVEAGATAKVSSIHVNGWFGDFDKLSMIRRFAAEALGLDLERPEDRAQAVYVGDSPNDEPAFAFFESSVGVANVRDFGDRLTRPPRFVTQARAGAGFAELARALLDAQEVG